MNITPWQERLAHSQALTGQFAIPKEDCMQAEIDELRAEIKRLTGIAFLASAERDELHMELGDLPEAQADMLATIKAQRKVLERALAAMGKGYMGRNHAEYSATITAIQEQLK